MEINGLIFAHKMLLNVKGAQGLKVPGASAFGPTPESALSRGCEGSVLSRVGNRNSVPDENR